jgi:hypothetical protein
MIAKESIIEGMLDWNLEVGVSARGELPIV